MWAVLSNLHERIMRFGVGCVRFVDSFIIMCVSGVVFIYNVVVIDKMRVRNYGSVVLVSVWHVFWRFICKHAHSCGAMHCNALWLIDGRTFFSLFVFFWVAWMCRKKRKLENTSVHLNKYIYI